MVLKTPPIIFSQKKKQKKLDVELCINENLENSLIIEAFTKNLFEWQSKLFFFITRFERLNMTKRMIEKKKLSGNDIEIFLKNIDIIGKKKQDLETNFKEYANQIEILSESTKSETIVFLKQKYNNLLQMHNELESLLLLENNICTNILNIFFYNQQKVLVTLYDIHSLVTEFVKLVDQTPIFQEGINTTKDVEVRVKNWADGFETLSHSLHNQAIIIIFPGNLFKDKIERKTFPLHWISMIGNDTKEIAPSLMKLTGVILGKLFSKPYKLEKWRVKYNPDGFPADIKQAWTNIGCVHGGRNRCFLCTIEFHSSNSKNNFDYSHTRNLGDKNVVFIMELFFKKKIENPAEVAKKYGLVFPHLFQAIAATIMEENNCSLEDTYPILQKCTCSPDCMHNNKGTMQRIVKVLTDNGRINKKLLKQ